MRNGHVLIVLDGEVEAWHEMAFGCHTLCIGRDLMHD